jgi:DNA-binding MarR family transcriptional regulator
MLLCNINVIKKAPMDPLIKTLEVYCHEVLDVQPHVTPWKEAAALPLFLKQAYDFYQASLLGNTFILALDKRKDEQPPAMIQKQLEQVRHKVGQEVVYLRPRITSHNRQRLIRHRVPFVVPGNQLYLPVLGMALRERFVEPQVTRPTMSPSTQVLVLHALYRAEHGPLTPGKMARLLHYAPMTMTRAFAELEQLGIGEHVVEHKNRRLVFPVHARKLWEQVVPLMHSPVRKRIFVEADVPGTELPIAGLTALARYTMIAEPAIPVYACGAETWKKLRGKVKMVPVPDTGSAEIELWRYRPDLFAEKGTADRLSLFLSLQGEKDERVAAALETMIEEMKW